MNCKTGAFGVNISVCEDCGCISIHNNSCRSRCCPMCQEFPKEKWIDARKENVLDAPYYHVVFTVPEEYESYHSKRFVRIRHYGLMSCRNKSKKMTHCRNLLGCKKYISALKNRSAAEMIKLLYNIDVCRCSSCGGKMVPHLPDKHTPSVLAHMRC